MPEEEKLNHKAPSEKQREQKIAPRRLETIFRTNMRVPYASGRYKHMLEMADERPWWRYRTVRDNRVRADHAALDGLIFHYTDPFWQTHYPPNGWNCRCEVESLDDIDMELDGLTPSDSSKFRVETNGVVGYDINGDTVIPETGWRYNPAQDGPGQMLELARRKAETYPPGLKEQFTADLDEAERANKERLEKLKAKNTTRDEEKGDKSKDDIKGLQIRSNQFPNGMGLVNHDPVQSSYTEYKQQAEVEPRFVKIVDSFLKPCKIDDKKLESELSRSLPAAISRLPEAWQKLWEIMVQKPLTHHFYLKNNFFTRLFSSEPDIPQTCGFIILANLAKRNEKFFNSRGETDYYDMLALGHEIGHVVINLCSKSYNIIDGSVVPSDPQQEIIPTDFLSPDTEIGRRLYLATRKDLINFLNKAMLEYQPTSRLLPLDEDIVVDDTLKSAYKKYLNNSYGYETHSVGLMALTDSLGYYTLGRLRPPNGYIGHSTPEYQKGGIEEGNAELFANISGVLLRNDYESIALTKAILPFAYLECEKICEDVCLKIKENFGSSEKSGEFSEKAQIPAADIMLSSGEPLQQDTNTQPNDRLRGPSEASIYLKEVLEPLYEQYEALGLGEGIYITPIGFPAKVLAYPGGVKGVYEEAIRRRVRWEDLVGMSEEDYHIFTRIRLRRKP